MVQTLDLSGTPKRLGGKDIGAWGVLLLPVLLLGGLLSIPIGLIIRESDRKRESRFAERMRAAGRTISSEVVADKIRACNGTLVREWKRMYKGPVRVWWTSVDHYKECPYPSLDLVTTWKDKTYHSFVNWCWLHYTNPETGKALLVEGPLPRKAAPGIDDIGDMRFIDIPNADGHRYGDRN